MHILPLFDFSMNVPTADWLKKLLIDSLSKFQSCDIIFLWFSSLFMVWTSFSSLQRLSTTPPFWTQYFLNFLLLIFQVKVRKIDGISLPYYEVNMTQGTPCDLTREPRRSRVLYVCQPEGHGEIYQFKEMSTCEYEVIILTAVLCAHPDFRYAHLVTVFIWGGGWGGGVNYSPVV